MDTAVPLDPNEASLDSSVAEVIGTLPLPIQEFIQSPKRDEVSIQLTQKYSLHADQAGRFEKAYLFMLMGIISPEQFVSDLQSSGISSETVKALANDVNEMVFKPLREKERTGVPVAQSPVYPKTPQPIAPPVVVAAPTTTTERAPAPYAGARPQPLTPFNLPGADAHPDDLFRSSTRTIASTSSPMPVPVSPEPKPAPIPTYVAVPPIPPVPMPPPTVTVTPAPSPTPVPPPPAHMPVEKVFTPPEPHSDNQSALGGTLRTMATDMLAVNEHRAPEPIQYKGTVYTPPVFMEAPTRPVPKPQLNRIQATPQPTPAQSAPGEVTRPTITPTPARELIKEYSSDPYREPV